MSKPIHRHRRKREEKFARLSEALACLAREQPELFDVELNKRVTNWLEEVQFRGRRLARKGGDIKAPSVFDLVKTIEQLLASHPDASRLISPSILRMLKDESSKAVARAVDPRLYKVVRSYRSTRVANHTPKS